MRLHHTSPAKLESPDATTQFLAADALIRAGSLLFDARGEKLTKSQAKGPTTLRVRRERTNLSSVSGTSCLEGHVQNGGKRSKYKPDQDHDSEKSWDKGLRQLTEQRLRLEQRDQRSGRTFTEVLRTGAQSAWPMRWPWIDVCDNSRNRCSSRVHRQQVFQPYTQ